MTTHFKNYYTVQSLRAFAALLVVVQHSSLMMRDKLGYDMNVFYAGASGVDIFFCISGFVMILTLHKHAGQKNSWFEFLSRRLLRIVPLYWILTFFKLILLLCLPHMATHSKISIGNTIGSFLFFPAWHGDEYAPPIIQVGWTLNFEMFFYVMFAIVLALQKRPLIWLTYIMLLLGFVGFFRTQEWGALSSLLRPLLIEFVLGMWVAWLVIKNKILHRYIAIFVIILSLTVISVSNQLSVEVVEGNWRIALWGLPSAALLLSMVSLEKYLHTILQGKISFLGSASYAIYLIQGFILAFMAILFRKIGFFPPEILLLICIFGIIIGGIITHLYLEVPITKKLKKIFFTENNQPPLV